MGSRGSGPASAVNIAAASATVRTIGPAVSCVWEMGMIPERPTRPTVGFSPTTPLREDGHTIEPLVSVPIEPAHRLAEVAAPDPADEPHGFRSTAYAFPH